MYMFARLYEQNIYNYLHGKVLLTKVIIEYCWTYFSQLTIFMSTYLFCGGHKYFFWLCYQWVCFVANAVLYIASNNTTTPIPLVP